MPCNSDYMTANEFEVRMSQVACLLDEINDKPVSESWRNGYHPAVYSKGLSKEDADNMVSQLCSHLRENDAKQYSLEMQIWWRDHQKADKQRLEKEMISKKTEREIALALAKLTDYEKKLLGLKND